MSALERMVVGGEKTTHHHIISEEGERYQERNEEAGFDSETARSDQPKHHSPNRCVHNCLGLLANLALVGRVHGRCAVQPDGNDRTRMGVGSHCCSSRVSHDVRSVETVLQDTDIWSVRRCFALVERGSHVFLGGLAQHWWYHIVDVLCLRRIYLLECEGQQVGRWSTCLRDFWCGVAPSQQGQSC